MKVTPFKGHVDSAYGKELPRPGVDFSGTYEHLETVMEIPTEENLSPADILDVVNTRRKASARAKATNDALQSAGIAKPDPNDPATMRVNAIKLTMKMYELDEATATRVVDAARDAALALK